MGLEMFLADFPSSHFVLLAEGEASLLFQVNLSQAGALMRCRSHRWNVPQEQK